MVAGLPQDWGCPWEAAFPALSGLVAAPRFPCQENELRAVNCSCVHRRGLLQEMGVGANCEKCERLGRREGEQSLWSLL